jgi:SecD/SecF fusion protein
LRSKSYLFLVVVLVLGLLAGFGFYKLPFHKGLDISGGVQLTYVEDLSKLPDPKDRQNPGKFQEQLVNILADRAHGPLGVAEPVVVAKGDDQILVDLPEFTDIKRAEDVMGSSARIEFYWARNVVTELPQGQNRPYVFEDSKDSTDPTVNFRTKIGNKLITPNDPEYTQIIKGWGPPILAGTDLIKAEPENNGATYIPLMHFSTGGGTAMETWSRNHYNQRELIAAVLDNKVLSIAALENNQVLGSEVTIRGTFPEGYVSRLCDLLNQGALPVDLKLLGAQRVDPTLGSQALDAMLRSGLIAFAVVSVFLIGYYAFPGFVAFLALSLYVLFTLTTLKLINATFSLAGIAGFILSVGMAVDANILVFERFKEEMRAGKSLTSAIELGFRRALPAIVDSNACTVITSLVLVQLGTGPVKGFATTLIIGVLISLFTAVVVTRSLLMFFVGSGIATNPAWYAVTRNWFGHRFDSPDAKPLQVVNKATKWFLFSGITIIVCIPFFFMHGFRLNVEFRGGYEASFPITATMTSDQIEESLKKNGLTGGNVQMASVDAMGNVPAHKVAIITLPPQQGIDLANSDAANLATIATAAGIQQNPDASFSKIGPQLQVETERNAVIGVVCSSCLIIVYLAFRFGIGFGGFSAGLRFGISAIGALIHDILVVFGTAAVVGFLFHWEVSALFLTAMLTIIGFSVHDTIVIFDRIRENLRRSKKTEEFGDLINRSITQSFTRSINTSMTVIVTLMILVFFGTTTPELKFFVASMMIGIISGTYSSIYNASPILYLWDRAIARSKPQSSLVAMANAEIARTRTLTTAAAQPESVSTASGRTYGQVRRRANAPATKGIELDD